MQIAVLITCYNRVNSTLKALDHLFACAMPVGVCLDVYLVDDASPDGTGLLVKQKYPRVRVVQGTGELYWCGGMRLAWEVATKNNEYDAFIWLNDDTFLYTNWAQILLSAVEAMDSKSILIGALCDPTTKRATYGFTGSPPRAPDGTLSPIREKETINGNFVYISRSVWLTVGSLRPCFTHGMGDTDYGYRAQKKGINIWLTPRYIGECSANSDQNCMDIQIPILKRLRLLHSPKGCPPWQYMRLAQVAHPCAWPLYVANLYWRTFFPRKKNRSNIPR